MPVQINEVIIRTIVDQAPAGGSVQSTAAATSNEAEFDALEKVLEIIKEKQER
jgi:hypothetical protein